MEKERGTKPANRLGQSSASAEETLTYQFDSLSFAIQKNRRYHEKLLVFYSVWRDRMKIVTAVAGSGAFLLVVGRFKPYDELLSAFIALWATMDIVVSPDKKADRSRELYERFTDLASKIERSQHTDDNYRELVASRMQIEKAEMPLKRIVDLEARNDECRARNYPPDLLVPLSALQKSFGYYVTFGMDRLEKWKSAQQRGH